VVDAVADLLDDPAQRVAQRRERVELAHRLAVGGRQPVGGHALHDLGDLVRPRLGLAEQRHARLGHLHQFGAGGDQRERRAHQHPTRLDRGQGDVDEPQLTGLVVLHDLFHAVSFHGWRMPGCSVAPRYQYSSASTCQRCLLRSCLPAASSSASRRSASRRNSPEETRAPSCTTSRSTGARSRLIQARRGAENRPFGRWTISRGSTASAAFLSASLPCLPATLSLPASANAASTTLTSTNGTRTSVEAAMLARSV